VDRTPIWIVSKKNRLSQFFSLAVSLALAAVVPTVSEAQAAATKHQKAVLVTGAGNGIGHKITEKLAADGYFVYAGARKDEDFQHNCENP
jgi:NADP-dependent 3-hydroxy acid dehydrogenase YdfG